MLFLAKGLRFRQSIGHPEVVPIDWKPTEIVTRDGRTRAAELGSVVVPEDREGSGANITVRFLRLKCPNPSGPPVLFLSGGPGDSGIQWASHGPFLEVFDRVAEHVDVILVDQRGSGSSDRRMPVHAPKFGCDDLASEEAMYALIEQQVGLAVQAAIEQGGNPSAYSVLSSAADLIAIADALEVERVSLWGYSYGTHLAQMTTKLYGDRIDRVVLCCFEGPNQTFKFPANMDAQLLRLDSIYPGFVNDVRFVHEQLNQAPIDVSGLWWGSFAMKHLCASWCGISNRFTRLPGIYRSLAEGTSDVLEKNLKDYTRLWSRPLVFYTTDGASGATAERWKEITAQAQEAILSNAANFPFPAISAVVKARDMGDQMRENLETDLPMLLLTGTLDGFTPTENALGSLDTLENAHHIMIHNAAHNDMFGSSTAVEAIVQFIGYGVKPEIVEANMDKL